MPLRIRIKNRNKKIKVDRKAIKKTAVKILRKFGKSEALVDITFIGNSGMKALNEKYMARKGPTDVLSFSLGKNTPGGRCALIGDIYISSDTARANAKRFKTGFRKEALLYTIHGLLHLLGFGDKTAGEKKRIRELEAKLLKCHDKSLSKV